MTYLHDKNIKSDDIWCGKSVETSNWLLSYNENVCVFMLTLNLNENNQIDSFKKAEMFKLLKKPV